ncbi:hypothetical protein [Sinorhizobium meliloti]|uniref:hypothetical protein n=1 Tax=Rhizobium meliloti TaxID=382 RepID=UPI0013E391E4|nr:hypothetical protein [Sinorhizobium meliloti]
MTEEGQMVLGFADVPVDDSSRSKASDNIVVSSLCHHTALLCGLTSRRASQAIEE